MPLIKSKSKKAFSENVKKEMESGKPQKQSLAIAYATKRAAGKKKMAKGGMVPAGSKHDGNPGTPSAKPDDKKIPDSESMSDYATRGSAPARKPDDRRLPEEQYMANHFAHGGDVDKHLSIAENILRKRKMMAEGGEVSDDVSDLDQTPLVDQDDHYDQQNGEAAEKPLYDDSQLSPQPWDSNQHGDSEEEESENTLDMIGKIRKKLRMKS